MDEFGNIEGPQAQKWRDMMSVNLGFTNRQQQKAKLNFQDHMQSLQNLQPVLKQKDRNFLKLLELDKFGQEQDARRMNIAKELMNIKSSNLVKNVISDSAPSNVRTPLYSAYAFDIEYLSPFLRTLNERIQKLNDANDYLQRDLNIISQYLNISINENKQLRENMIKRDRTMEQVLDTINEETIQKINQYDRKLQLLSEENNILISQCENYKLYKSKFDAFQQKKNQELESAAELYDTQSKAFQELKEREQEITDKHALLENKNNDLSEQLNELQLEHEDCKAQNDILQHDLDVLSEEHQKLKKEFHEENHKLRTDVTSYQNENIKYNKNLKDTKDALKNTENKHEKIKYEHDKAQKRLKQILLEYEKVKNTNSFLTQQNNTMRDQILLLEKNEEDLNKKLNFFLNTNENLDISNKNMSVQNQRLQEQHKSAIQQMTDQHSKEAQRWEHEKLNLQRINDQQQFINQENLAIRQQYESLMRPQETFQQFQQRIRQNELDSAQLQELLNNNNLLSKENIELKSQNIEIVSKNQALEEDQKGIKIENREIIDKLNELSDLEERNNNFQNENQQLKTELAANVKQMQISADQLQQQTMINKRLQDELGTLNKQLVMIQNEMAQFRPQQAQSMQQVKMIRELEAELSEVDQKNEVLIKENRQLHSRKQVLEGLCQKLMRSDPRYANSQLPI